MASIERRLKPLGDAVTKIVVTHHPFDVPDEVGEVDVVGRARQAMAVFSQCGVDLLLSGHFHISQSGETTGDAIAGYSALAVQAGTATSTRGRGEENSFNVVRLEKCDIAVERWGFQRDARAFKPDRNERFVREGERWIER